MLGRQSKVYMTIKDHSLRFIEAGKNHIFYEYGQKCLPKGVIHEGQITDRETLAMLMEEMISDFKLKGKKLSFCIPDSVVVVRKVQVPPEILEDELKGYLYMELGESIHLPFENPILEAVLVDENTSNREVLLIASREDVLNDFASLFKKVSLKTEVADLSILSYYRVLYHAGLTKREDHLLLVQIGLDNIMLSVFHHDQPVFVRIYPLDFSEKEVEVAKSRSGTEFFNWVGSYDSLIRKCRDVSSEIERFLSYYHYNFSNGTQSITNIVVTGDHPCTETFVNEIKASIDITIDSFIDPLFQTKKGINIPAVYMECLGLSFK